MPAHVESQLRELGIWFRSELAHVDLDDMPTWHGATLTPERQNSSPRSAENAPECERRRVIDGAGQDQPQPEPPAQTFVVKAPSSRAPFQPSPHDLACRPLPRARSMLNLATTRERRDAQALRPWSDDRCASSVCG